MTDSDSKPLYFVTGNQTKHDEITELLSGIPVVTAKLALDRVGDTIEEAARNRAIQAYAILQAPCFTEMTELSLEGMPTLSGAQYKKRLLAEDPAALRELGGRHGMVRVALAYAVDADTVHLFTSESHGYYLREPRGSKGYGWDPYWVPDGYSRTLAEGASNKAFVNMRRLPYLDLGDHLREREYGGSFEAHVTVSPLSAEETTRFVELCEELEVKPVVIELPRGKVRAQPMTASYHHGTLRSAIDDAHGLAQKLAAAGYDVTRVKLEAVGRNRDIPEEDENLDPANYFEFHIKVILPPDTDTRALLAVAETHSAHLSRNARKTREDGAQERFVTLRLYDLGKKSAEERFGRLVEDVKELGHPLGQLIREYTVYDSNIGVDEGWLQDPS